MITVVGWLFSWLGGFFSGYLVGKFWGKAAILLLLSLCLLTGCDSSVSAGGSSIDVVGSFTRGIR